MKVLNSLRARLTIPIILLSLSLLFVTILFFGQRQLRDVRQSVISQTRGNLRLIAEYASVPLVCGQPEEAKEVLLKIKHIGSILSAAIYRNDGQLFTSVGTDPVKTYLQSGLPENEITMGEKSIFISVPIEYREVKYGILVAEMDTRVQGVLVKKMYLLFLIFFASMGILSVIAAFLFERKFLKPILVLSQKFKEAAVMKSFIKPLSPLPVPGKSSNEIKVLITGYNRMVSALTLREKQQAEAEAALKDMNEKPDPKVAARTKELEARNKELKKLYEDEKVLIENLPYGIILHDSRLKVIEINSFAKRLLGVTEMMPVCAREFFLNSRKDVHPDSYMDEETALKGTTQSVLSDSKGAEIPVLQTVVPIIYNDQKVLMNTFVDITDLQNVQKELKLAKEKAEESDRLKSSFLANMSHEIRTPLNAIVGFTGMLVSEDLEQERKDTFKQIVEENTESLLNLIEDILDLSKLESGTLAIRPGNVNIAAFSENIYKNSLMMQARLNKKRCKLFLDLDPVDEDATGFFDSLRISQVVLNLMNNAIKFTEQGSITFGIRNMDDRFLFYIQDTGPGIDLKIRDHVFDRFCKSNVKLYGGTGLGLAISKSLVELSGGEIWFETASGKGTTFFFTIPQFRKK